MRGSLESSCFLAPSLLSDLQVTEEEAEFYHLESHHGSHQLCPNVQETIENIRAANTALHRTVISVTEEENFYFT